MKTTLNVAKVTLKSQTFGNEFKIHEKISDETVCGTIACIQVRFRPNISNGKTPLKGRLLCKHAEL